MRNLKSQGAKELADIKEKEKLDIDIFELDVTDQKSVDQGMKEILAKHPNIDVLINNAGLGYMGPVEEFEIDEIKQQFDTNVFGAMRMFKKVAPLMRQRHQGMIINISSICGLISTPLYGVYSASKFALEALSEASLAELKPFGVKVAVVEPGTFATRFSNNLKFPQSLKSINESPYFGLMDKFVKGTKTIINKIVSRLGNSEKVAKLIYKIANQENPRLRNVIGMDAKTYLIIRRILGQNLWMKLLSRVYQW